jgi:Uma2 family endonuclease
MALKVKHLMTINDLEAIPYDESNRYELIEGELYVSCAPGIPHQLVLHNLDRKLGNYLEQNPIGKLVPGPGVVFNKYNSVIPDIVFVSNERWRTIVAKSRFNAAPDLVIEILSPDSSNRSRDLKLKHKVYAKFGVPEYWVVDTWARSVSVFRLADNSLEEVATLRQKDQLESPLFPGLSLKLSDIFTDDLSEFLT